MLKWRIDSSDDHLSVASRETLRRNVFVDEAGTILDPTADVIVEWAFIANAHSTPEELDWVAGAWDTTLIRSFVATIDAGPGGAVEPSMGRWYAWIRLTDPDTDEEVVRSVGKLFVD